MSDLGDMLHGGKGTPLSRVLRWLIPGLMVAAGILLLIFGSGEAADGLGVALAFGSLVVVFAGWFGRLGDDSARIAEETAREERRRTGRWPDES